MLERLLRPIGVAAILLFVWQMPAHAAPIIFDFEAEALSTSVSSLTITQSGLTITVTQPTQNFRVRNPNSTLPGAPSIYGVRSLLGGGLSARPFVVTFSEPVSSVSIDGGDVSGPPPGDEFDNITLTAFDGAGATGNQLGTDSVLNCCGAANGWEFATVDVSAAGIRSIRFIGGSTGAPISVFFDNLCVDPTGNGCPSQAGQVPEPGTLTAMSVSLIGLLAARRRRNAVR